MRGSRGSSGCIITIRICRTILVNRPGVEQLESVIRRGDAVLAEEATDLVQKLATAPLARSADYYSAPIGRISAAVSGAVTRGAASLGKA